MFCEREKLTADGRAGQANLDGDDAEQLLLLEAVAAVLLEAIAAAGGARLHLDGSGRGREGKGEDAEDGGGKHVD